MKIETKYSIGDIFSINDTQYWTLHCTAITVKGSGKVEYCLEWIGNGDFREQWITAERMKILGIEKKKGKEKV